jgi:hypothetical protein
MVAEPGGARSVVAAAAAALAGYSIIDLGVLPGRLWSITRGINNQRQIVGTSGTRSDGLNYMASYLNDGSATYALSRMGPRLSRGSASGPPHPRRPTDQESQGVVRVQDEAPPEIAYTGRRGTVPCLRQPCPSSTCSR